MGFDASRYARDLRYVRDANKLLEQYRKATVPAVPINIPKVQVPTTGVAAAVRSLNTASSFLGATKAKNRYPVSGIIPSNILKQFPLTPTWSAVATSSMSAAMALDLSSKLRNINSQMLATRSVARAHRVWRTVSPTGATSFHRAMAALPQDQISSVARIAKSQPFYGLSGQKYVLGGYQARRSTAFNIAFKNALSYGPIVVTPDRTTPPPPSRPRSAPPKDRMPDTTTSTEDRDLFEEMWEDVMGVAQSIAQHHGTKVIVRFIGNNAAEIIVGTVTTTIGTVAGGIILRLL